MWILAVACGAFLTGNRELRACQFWFKVIWTTLLHKLMSKMTLLTTLRDTSTPNRKIQWFDQGLHKRQDCNGLLTQTAQEEEEEEEVIDVYQAHTACNHKSKYTRLHFLASTTIYIYPACVSGSIYRLACWRWYRPSSVSRSSLNMWSLLATPDEPFERS